MGRGAAWTSRWNTPGYESSSAGPSAASRPSNTTWPTCWSPSSWPPRSPGTRPEERPPRPKRSWRPRRRPAWPCAATRSARTRPSRSSAASASPGSTTPTSTSGARRRSGPWWPPWARPRTTSTKPPTCGVRRQFAVELPEEADAYRAEARAFLDRYRAAPEEERRALLVSSGYLVPHWAEPFGRGAGAIEQLVLEEELAGIEMPSLGIGGWVLLTLTQTADQEQIERWITPSLLGELRWCQLFSEPDMRLRRGRRADPRRTRRGRLAGDRPEGVDQRRAGLQPGPRDGTDRPKGAQAPGHHGDGRRPHRAWRRDPAAARDHRGRAVQRGLLRRRVRPRRRHRR